jgi:hypothetical protein
MGGVQGWCPRQSAKRNTAYASLDIGTAPWYRSSTLDKTNLIKSGIRLVFMASKKKVRNRAVHL